MLPCVFAGVTSSFTLQLTFFQSRKRSAVGRHSMMSMQAHTQDERRQTKKRRAASKDLMRKVTGETENKTQGHCLEKHGKHVAFGRACLLGISCTWGGARVLTLLSTPLKPTQYRVPYCRPIPRLFALPCVWSLSLMPCVSTHPASFRGSSARLCSALGISFLFPCNVNFAHPYGWNTT